MVGITGGIAAYKAVGVVRLLVLAGHDVQVVATEAALRFVGRPTLEALSRNPVHTELYEGVAEVRHVAIGQSADLIVIAPATANTLAKLAADSPTISWATPCSPAVRPSWSLPRCTPRCGRTRRPSANVATLRARGRAHRRPGQRTADRQRTRDPDGCPSPTTSSRPHSPP